MSSLWLQLEKDALALSQLYFCLPQSTGSRPVGLAGVVRSGQSNQQTCICLMQQAASSTVERHCLEYILDRCRACPPPP